MDDDGDFVIAWQGPVQGGSSYGIFAQRFSSAGDSLGGEFQVNSHTFSYQSRPAVAADAGGDFVVVWRRRTHAPFPDFYDILAQRFSSAGAPLGGEFQVNTNTIHYFLYPRPAIAADPAGEFVIVWEGVTADYCCLGIFGRRFSSAGTPLATELEINSSDVGLEILLAVASGADGNFVVSWDGSGEDGSLEGIRARRFASVGAPLGSELQVNSYTNGNQRFPAVAADAAGNFVIAWSSDLQDGSEWGVFAQRFAVPTPTATATATATVTPTASLTPTSTSTPTVTPVEPYEIPTLSRGAMATLALLLLTVCFAYLLRRRTGPG